MLGGPRFISPAISIRFVAGLFCCALGFSLAACKSDYQGSTRQNRPGENKAARQVKTARVEETPFGETVTANGTLAAFDQSTAGVKVAGRLGSITVDLGSVVRRGQLIAQIEPNDYKLRVQQAEAALAQARARVGLSPDGKDDSVKPEDTGTVRQAKAVLDEAKVSRERAAKLVQQGIVARSEYDTVDAAYKVAVSRYQDALEEIRNRQALVAQRRSELALARQQLADTAVQAPIDGIVQEKRASVGEYLAAGAPVVDIVRLLGQNAPLDPGAGQLFELTGGVTYQPTSELRTQFNIVKQSLKRRDTGRMAFDVNILTFRGTYQFSRATFARAIFDYNTISSRLRAQLLAGWTPSPGTAFYVGYNDDLNYAETNPFTRDIVPGFRRNARTYFIKMSYLFRKGFGG